MYKIAAVGDKDSIYGFASVGLDIYPVYEAQEASKRVRKLADNGYAVIYVTEQVAAMIEAEMEHFRESALPAIIPIPGVKENTGLGMRQVSKSVEQAVGSDIIS